MLEAGNLGGDHPEGERGRAALLEAVDAEAREVGGHVGRVQLAGGAEAFEPVRRALGHSDEDRLQVGFRERLPVLERAELAVAAQDRREAELQVHVGRTRVDDGRHYGVALEANVPYGVVSEDEYRGLLCLELANVPGGYGWVFPKGDHVNVGVGGWEREGPRLRAHLARFCREYGIPESSLENVRGHRLPLLHARARVARGRVALLGDAAGLVDPLSGDGMYEAFLSAKLATDALLAGDLQSYDVELRRRLSSQLSAAWGAKVALDRFPRLTYAVVRTPFLWNAVVSLIGGDVPSPSAMRGLRRASMRVVDGIARAAGNPGRPYKAAQT